MNKRSASSYVTAIAAVLLGGFAFAYQLIYSPEAPNWTGASAVALCVSLVFQFYVYPSVQLIDCKVIVTNPFQVTEVGLGLIEEVETRHQLTLKGAFGTIRVWSAPAPGRLTHKTRSGENLQKMGLDVGEVLRPGDVPTSLCGSVALQIRRSLKSKDCLSTSFSRRPNWIGLAPFLASVVMAVLSFQS